MTELLCNKRLNGVVVSAKQSRCKEFYIGETKRNSEVRWNKHFSLKKNPGVGGHILVNLDYNITWQITAKIPRRLPNRKYEK